MNHLREVILILFAVTLLYSSISHRLRGLVDILAFQGFLLFILSFVQLIDVTPINLAFILLETLMIKTFALPWFLKYIIKKNKITRETEPYVPYFISLMIVTAAIIGSFYSFQILKGKK